MSEQPDKTEQMRTKPKEPERESRNGPGGRSCFVYLIAGADAVKVGISADPAARLAILQAASPSPLALYHTFECTDQATAYTVEQAAHGRLHKCRAHGEWFSCSPQDAFVVVADLVGWEPTAEEMATFFCDEYERAAREAASETKAAAVREQSQYMAIALDGLHSIGRHDLAEEMNHQFIAGEFTASRSNGHVGRVGDGRL